ncbi:class I SAM-dependent methyltransferase [Frankia sp. R82]|uniref:class I SAM-dependent methyltransferase n=1 Tax=Frankia sp. R82 TaxID=2950553 RepID=UPI0020444F4D|nr:class I SAM-dependent methyltransferase [Frankia sp. R82]MCM3882227.1 methyltransferase domain-containing protein [Frankia sp. R82]
MARPAPAGSGAVARARIPDVWHVPHYAVRFVDDATELNRARWDELARLHGQDDYYDVEGFLAGQLMLSAREREEMAAAVGSVSGVDLLHMQCHFGLGTLSWARLGARVTGLDFSPVAVERARVLATAVGIDARFVRADAQQLPADLAGAFDVVFASYGVLSWIADVTAWMTAAATALRPGGVLVLVDGHPLTQMIDSVDPVRFDFPYQGSTAHHIRSASFYASSATQLTTTETVQYPHGLGEIVTAAAAAGLHVDALTEYLDSDGPEGRADQMRCGQDGRWQLILTGQPVPVQYALRATQNS